MLLRFDASGDATAIYDEAIELDELGEVRIERASHVEPTSDAEWTADMAPVGGPVLGPFARRSEALAAEVSWLEKWLGGSPS